MVAECVGVGMRFQGSFSSKALLMINSLFGLSTCQCWTSQLRNIQTHTGNSKQESQLSNVLEVLVVQSQRESLCLYCVINEKVNMCAGMVRMCVYLSLVLLLGFSLWEPADGRRTRAKPKPKPKPDKKLIEEFAPAQNVDISKV